MKDPIVPHFHYHLTMCTFTILPFVVRCFGIVTFKSLMIFRLIRGNIARKHAELRNLKLFTDSVSHPRVSAAPPPKVH